MILKAFDIFFIVCIGLFLLTYLPKIIYFFIGLRYNKKKNELPKAKANHKFAVLIPARNESSVIDGLLKSLKNQTYSRDYFDIFIAIENEKDKTVEIAKSYNAEIYLKKDFTKKGKGYVLTELINHIFQNRADKNYEAFLIVDADNILAENFIDEMNDAFDSGFDVALGNRNSKNWNDGWLASCTGLTFIRFSRFQNFARSIFKKTTLLSGTGFYIKSDIVKDMGGWVWHSLTEDYELTLNCAINKYSTHFCHNAEFYDEQPTDLKTSFNQRKRWCRGYFDNGKKYNKKLLKSFFNKKSDRFGTFELVIGVFPLVFIILGLGVYLIANTVIAIVNFSNSFLLYGALFRIAVALALYYFILVLDAFLMLFAIRKTVNIKKSNFIKTVLMNPFYALFYIPIAISALFTSVEWLPIEHKVNMKIDSKK